MAYRTLRVHLGIGAAASFCGFVAVTLPLLRWWQRGQRPALALPGALFFGSLAFLLLGVQLWQLLGLQRGVRRGRDALAEAVLERRPSTFSSLARLQRSPGFLVGCELLTPVLAMLAGGLLALGVVSLEGLGVARAALVMIAGAAALLVAAASLMVQALQRDGLELCASTQAAFASLCRRDDRRSGLHWPATSAPPRDAGGAVLCGGLGLVGVLGLTVWLWPRGLAVFAPESLLRWLGVVAGLGLAGWLVCLARLWFDARSYQQSLVSMQRSLGSRRAGPSLLRTSGIRVHGHLVGLLAGLGMRGCAGVATLAVWGLLSGWSAAADAALPTWLLLATCGGCAGALLLTRSYVARQVATLHAWQATSGVFLRWLDDARPKQIAAPEQVAAPPWKRDLRRADVGLLGLLLLVGLISLLPPARHTWARYLLTHARPAVIRLYAEQILRETTDSDDLLSLVAAQRGQSAAVVGSLDRRARQLARELSTEQWLALIEQTSDPSERASLFALHRPWLRQVSLLDSHQLRVARIVCALGSSSERASLHWLRASLPAGEALRQELWQVASGPARTRALQALAVCGDPRSIDQAAQGGPALLAAVARHVEPGFLARSPELIRQCDNVLLLAPADTAQLELVTILSHNLIPRLGGSRDIYRNLVGTLGFLERFPDTPAGRVLADPGSEAGQALERYRRAVEMPMPVEQLERFTRLLRDTDSGLFFRLGRAGLPGLLSIIVDERAFGLRDALWWVQVCVAKFPTATDELLWEELGRRQGARRVLEALAYIGDQVAWHSLLTEDPAALRAVAELLPDDLYTQQPGLITLWEERLFEAEDCDRVWLLSHLCARLARESDAAPRLHNLIQRFVEAFPAELASRELARSGSPSAALLASYEAEHSEAGTPE